MAMVSKLLTPFAVLALLSGTAIAQQRSWGPPSRVKDGLMPYDQLKAIADRATGGRLIGSEYDRESWTYQMRYMRGTEIIDVVIDARSGRILGRRESM